MSLARWVAAQLAGGNLRVLSENRRLNVSDGQLKLIEFDWIKPDAHGVLGAEGLHIADAWQPADRILNRSHAKVAQVCSRQAPIGRDEPDDDEEILDGLEDRHTLGLYDRGQQRLGVLHLILHLHLGDVRIGAHVECDGDDHGSG